MQNLQKHTEENQIRCIFFCEFHPTAGPIISCQVPDHYISKELFDSVSVYIITKPELQRSTFTVSLSECKILGFPVRIDDKKYPRNAFHFNLCFVCDPNARTVQYEPVVTKFSDYLIAMEIESSFLSDGHAAINLIPILTKALNELNTRGECALIEGPNATHLKVVDVRSDPYPVSDHQVPVFIAALPSQQWDLTTQQVAPYIDGFNHVARIANLSDVENNLVKACIQNLVYYGVVALLPLFQYGNVYCTTPKLRMLAQDDELQKRCLEYVALTRRQPPTFRDVFRFYASMVRGTTVRDLCLRHAPALRRINERKLVQFGVLEDLIRRINKYPIAHECADEDELRRSFGGLANLDEICCSTCVPAHRLDDRLERDPHIVLLYK